MAEKKLHLNFGGYSSAGVKELNQDAFTARIPSEHSARKYKGGAACIADGVSCSTNAQLASQTAATNFISDYFNTPDYWTVEQSASKVISSINSWLYQQSLQNHTRSDGYVTTFSSLIIKSHTAHILHAGDSRIYLLRDQQLELLTDDHNYKQGNENILARALGIEKQLDLDYRCVKVQLGDRFILTTDGVHDHLSAKILQTLASGANDLESLAKTIATHALESGSQDNVSCLMVDVESLPVMRIEELYNDLATLAIPPVLEPTNTIDSFEIIRVLHSGPRSHVYLARNQQDDRQYVLKMPSLNFSDDVCYLEAFAREQWIGRKMSHPQLMRIYPPTQNSSFLYHVCEYVEGTTLRQWMIDNPKPSFAQSRTLLESLIHPVRVLHRNKMVHRDLKPENFIINRDGVATLIDFGAIRIAGIEEISNSSQQPLGDLAYIAPEYLLHGVATDCSDLFSLATIYYEMISGELPYKMIKSNRDIPNNIQAWRYKPLNTLAESTNNMPRWLDTVLKTALAPNAKYRYQAKSTFLNDLKHPSQEILKSIEFRPLIERNPLRFWQLVSAALFILLLIQSIRLLD